MSKIVFAVLLLTYLLLMAVTGGFAAFMALGANLPPPNVMRDYPKFDDRAKDQIWAATKGAEEKTKKLSEVATSGFQITLGALIGFLSAVGATYMRLSPVGPRRQEDDPSPTDREPSA